MDGEYAAAVIRRPLPRRPLPTAKSFNLWLLRGLLALGVIGLLVVWALAAGQVLDAGRARFSGVSGTMTGAHCDWTHRKWTSDGWLCHGSFDGGGLHLYPVYTFVSGQPKKSPSSVAGRVSGPGADTMYVDGEIEWLFPTVFMVVGLVVAGYLLVPLVQWLRRVRKRRRRRRKPPRPDGWVPQLGARAQSRRRKPRPPRPRSAP